MVFLCSLKRKRKKLFACGWHWMYKDSDWYTLAPNEKFVKRRRLSTDSGYDITDRCFYVWLTTTMANHAMSSFHVGWGGFIEINSCSRNIDSHTRNVLYQLLALVNEWEGSDKGRRKEEKTVLCGFHCAKNNFFLSLDSEFSLVCNSRGCRWQKSLLFTRFSCVATCTPFSEQSDKDFIMLSRRK